MKIEYLTDEELAQLIADVEANELVAAPPDLCEEIVAKVEQMSSEIVRKTVPEIEKTLLDRRDKKREFKRYCFQVITSMAAAVALVFLLPNLQESQDLRVPSEKSIFGASVYETKQEALEDKGLLMEAFGGFNIFSQTDQFQIFKR